MESEEKERYVASKRFYTPLLTLVTSNSLINSCVERGKETTSLWKKKKRALREKSRGCGDERSMERWKGIQRAKRRKRSTGHMGFQWLIGEDKVWPSGGFPLFTSLSSPLHPRKSKAKKDMPEDIRPKATTARKLIHARYNQRETNEGGIYVGNKRITFKLCNEMVKDNISTMKTTLLNFDSIVDKAVKMIYWLFSCLKYVLILVELKICLAVTINDKGGLK